MNFPMKSFRRGFFKLLAAGAVGLALAGCAPMVSRAPAQLEPLAPAADAVSPALERRSKSLAAIAVDAAAKIDGQHLDYSPASLKIVDQLVLGFRKDGATTKTMNKVLFTFGCYVGEVMVRNLGYKWDNPNEKTRKLE